jgi:hypothetical protein
MNVRPQIPWWRKFIWQCPGRRQQRTQRVQLRTTTGTRVEMSFHGMGGGGSEFAIDVVIEDARAIGAVH